MQKSIKTLSRQYFLKNHLINKTFIPGVTPVKVSGRVFDEKEIEKAIEASLEFWLTEGNFAAFSALTSPKLGRRQIKQGDEVITVACSFPTTINPIIQYGALPVFVDV